MKNQDLGFKRVTLPFIGRCLKSMGFEAIKESDSYYVDLGLDSKLVIKFRYGSISAAVVMPAGWDEINEQLLLASMTMASTTLIKVFLLPEGEGLSIWFSADWLCKTRMEFVGVFNAMFNQLMKSVRTFVEIRNNIKSEMQIQSMATMLMTQKKNQLLN